MKKFVLFYCIIVLFCSCSSMKNLTYTDYEHSIDLTYLQNDIFYVPSFNISIENNNYHANFQTGTNINTVSKDIIDELGIEYIDDDFNVNISQIILGNGIVLNNVIFHVIEPDDNIIKISLGLSAFKEYNILVSYKQKKIYLYNIGTTPSNITRWVPVTVVFPEEGLYIYSVVDGSNNKYLTLLSTGATLYIGGIFNRHYNIGLNTNIPVATFFRSSIYISGKKYRTHFFNSLSDIEKEDNNLGGLLTDLILGYAFFSKYDLFIDNNSRRIYLENP